MVKWSALERRGIDAQDEFYALGRQINKAIPTEQGLSLA